MSRRAGPLPPPAASRAGLPRFVLPVALLGCAILLISTLPALVARRRLDRAGRGIESQVRAMEEATQRVRRDRRALLTDQYVVERAMRDLLEPGPRVAAPRPAGAAEARPAGS